MTKRSRPKTIAGIRKQLSYGPLQERKSFNSGKVSVQTYNECSYSVIENHNTFTELHGFLSTYKPYYVRDAVAAGSYTGALEMVQRDMGETALAYRGAKINYRGGTCIYTFRNNWDAIGTMSLYVFVVRTDTGTTPEGLYDEHLNDIHRSSVTKEQLLLDGLTTGKEAWGPFWDQMGKTQTITLQPGEQFDFKFKLPKGVFDDDNAQTSLTYQKNLSVRLVCRMIGGVVHDSTDTTLVGTGKCQIDWIRRKYESWRHITDTPLPTTYSLITKDTIANGIHAQLKMEHQDGDGDADD